MPVTGSKLPPTSLPTTDTVQPSPTPGRFSTRTWLTKSSSCAVAVTENWPWPSSSMHSASPCRLTETSGGSAGSRVTSSEACAVAVLSAVSHSSSVAACSTALASTCQVTGCSTVSGSSATISSTAWKGLAVVVQVLTLPPWSPPARPVTLKPSGTVTVTVCTNLEAHPY